ncbi:MAG: hypothetical protein LBH46_04105 [Rickettsiales bacterium]|jgi:hypothetical protein|nr:hypothetical protein [Rickettsiales bacterium]
MFEYSIDDTIFVQIASFRDRELQLTLKDLFEKASKPENVFVGVCHQYDMQGDEDEALFEIPFPYPEQLRIDNVDYRDSQGACWARARVQKLYKNEKWTLMIDSHMRFGERWDEIMVTNLKKEIFNRKKEKIILSTYPSGYLYDSDNEIKYTSFCDGIKTTHLDNGVDGYALLCSLYLYFDNGYLRQIPVVSYDIRGRIHYGFSANFAFASSLFINEIQYDENLFFAGEEPTIAIRCFTKGWDILPCMDSLIYHLYNVENHQKDRISRKINVNVDNDNISKMRQRHLLNIEKTRNVKALKDMDKYGLGQERTIREFEHCSGVCFNKEKTRLFATVGLIKKYEKILDTKVVKELFDDGN